MGNDNERKTWLGYRSPSSIPGPLRGQRGSSHPAAPGSAGLVPPPTPRASPAGTIPFEVDVIHEKGSPASLEQAWCAVEIWTLNRIYRLDSDFVCRSVSDRTSGAWLDSHDAIGAKLIGGQRRAPNGAIERVTHPLPITGDSAVFVRPLGKRLNYSETSEVVRVTLRQRVLDVTPETPPSWDSMARRRWSQ